ncbi:MAG: UvrD-helicase domain-containing protein, partial [Sarcina sp.]
MHLNEKQKLVVETLDKNIFLIASAGTGKTAVLSERVYNILSQNLAKEEEVLCITFTNKAAKEMKDRIEFRLGGSVKCTIKTFHSFCLEVIRENAKNRMDIPSDFIVVDEEDAREAVKKIASIQASGYDKNFIDIAMIHKFIDTVKDYRLKNNFFSEDEESDYKNCIKDLELNNIEILMECFKDNKYFNKNLKDYMIKYG